MNNMLMLPYSASCSCKSEFYTASCCRHLKWADCDGRLSEHEDAPMGSKDADPPDSNHSCSHCCVHSGRQRSRQAAGSQPSHPLPSSIFCGHSPGTLHQRSLQDEGFCEPLVGQNCWLDHCCHHSRAECLLGGCQHQRR